jgi:hypothetical protein
MASIPRKRRLVLVSGTLLASYLGLYLFDAAFGGYDPHYNSDGRSRYTFGLLVHDCIMWQPRIGCYYNEYKHDSVGIIFYPLIQLDHSFFHKTHSLADGDFPKWWESLTDAQIHPTYRGEYQSWRKEKAQK